MGLSFDLFRVRLFATGSIFTAGETRTRAEILRAAITNSPTRPLRGGAIWRIGSAREVGTDLYFRLGRMSSKKLSQFDEENHAFVDVDFADAPYVHAFMLFPESVLALSHRSSFPVKLSTAAYYFQNLIDSELADAGPVYEASVGPVKDPESFLAQLKEAEVISRVRFTFKRENPIDASEIVDPLKKVLKKIRGQRGAVEIVGESLDRDDVEEFAREAASNDEKASALVKSSFDAKPVTKRLGDNTAMIGTAETDESLPTTDGMIAVAAAVRQKYQAVRGTTGKGGADDGG